MKLCRLAAIVAVALTLAGCSWDQLTTGISIATTSSPNPITVERLNAVENGMIIAFATLKAYKASCDARAIPPSCRTVIQSIQVYTQKIPAALASVRAFVRNNNQVNAAVAYNELMDLVSRFKATATANNIQVQ